MKRNEAEPGWDRVKVLDVCGYRLGWHGPDAALRTEYVAIVGRGSKRLGWTSWMYLCDSEEERHILVECMGKEVELPSEDLIPLEWLNLLMRNTSSAPAIEMNA